MAIVCATQMLPDSRGLVWAVPGLKCTDKFPSFFFFSDKFYFSTNVSTCPFLDLLFTLLIYLSLDIKKKNINKKWYEERGTNYLKTKQLLIKELKKFIFIFCSFLQESSKSKSCNRKETKQRPSRKCIWKFSSKKEEESLNNFLCQCTN